MGDLGLGLITLRFKPFDEVQRVDRFSPTEGPSPRVELVRGKSALLQGRHRSNHQSAFRRSTLYPPQGNKRFESFANDVGMGQSGILGQCLPSRKKLRTLPIQPSGGIGVQLFLGFQRVRDGHDVAVRINPMQHGHQPCLRRRSHTLQTHEPAGLDLLAQRLNDRRFQPALQHGGRCGIQARKECPEIVEWRFWN